MKRITRFVIMSLFLSFFASNVFALENGEVSIQNEKQVAWNEESKQWLSLEEFWRDYAAKNGHNLVIADTAGRLHIDETMMNELVEVKEFLKDSITFLSLSPMFLVKFSTTSNGLFRFFVEKNKTQGV